MGLFWAVLGPSWAVPGPSWAVLAGLGRLGALWGPLGTSGDFLWPSWGSLGNPSGPSGTPLKPFGTLLGRLEALLGRLGALLGASRAVLGAILGIFSGFCFPHFRLFGCPALQDGPMEPMKPVRPIRLLNSRGTRKAKTTKRPTVGSGHSKCCRGVEFWEHEEHKVAYTWHRAFKMWPPNCVLGSRRAQSGLQLAPDIQNMAWEWCSGNAKSTKWPTVGIGHLKCGLGIVFWQGAS